MPLIYRQPRMKLNLEDAGVSDQPRSGTERIRRSPNIQKVVWGIYKNLHSITTFRTMCPWVTVLESGNVK